MRSGFDFMSFPTLCLTVRVCLWEICSAFFKKGESSLEGDGLTTSEFGVCKTATFSVSF